MKRVEKIGSRFSRDPIGIRNRHGMTLVELLVVLAILALASAAIYLPFKAQFWSATREGEVQKIQTTAQDALVLLQRDMLMAGYGVDKKLAFFIADGGNGPDALYINDWNFIDDSELLDGIYGESEITSFDNGTKRLELDKLNIDQTGVDNCYSSSCNEFKGGVWQTLITDTTDATQKVAKISSDNATSTSLILDGPVAGSYAAPAIYYCIDDGALKRSDRSTGGRQPVAENIVDMQIAYLDTSGTWHCDGGGASCPMDPFDPEAIDLVRITLVARSKRVKGAVRPAPIQAENGPTWSSGDFIYRKYTVLVRPRNTQF